MKQLRRWFRQVIPRLDFVLTFLVIVGGFELFLSFQEDLGGANRWNNEIRQIVGVVLIGLIGGFFYGVTRGSVHPILQPDYRTWLMNTPWRPGLPLPLGPVQLGLQDAIVFICLCSIFWGFSGMSPFYPLILGLLGYMAVTLVSLLRCRFFGYAFMIAMGAALTVRFMKAPEYAVAAVMATHLICHAGVKRSLAAFPWPEIEVSPVGSSVSAAHPNPHAAGWPCDVVRPLDAKDLKPTPLYRILAISALIGWWVYAIAGWLGGTKEALIPLMWIVAQGLALGRIVRYLANVSAPLSMGGRIRTGRLIMRGYDQVFAAPLAIFLTAALATWLIYHFNPPINIAASVAIGLVIWVGLAMGPKLTAWRMTGQFRFVDSAYKTANSGAAQNQKPFVAPG